MQGFNGPEQTASHLDSVPLYRLKAPLDQSISPMYPSKNPLDRSKTALYSAGILLYRYKALLNRCNDTFFRSDGHKKGRGRSHALFRSMV